MKVDKVDNVDEVAISRGVFIASFSAFIFTSLFSIALASSGVIGGNEVATAYYSGSQVKARDHVAQVVSAASGTKTTATATPVTTTVAPAPKPTVTLTINPTTVVQGVQTSVKLTWNSTNATQCLVKKNGVKFIDNMLSGTAPVSEMGQATFSVDCAGAGGTATASAGLTVATAPAPVVPTNPNVAIVQGPTSVTISANPTKVAKGGSTAISFTITPNLIGCLVVKNNTETPNSPFLKPEFSRNDGIQSGALNSNTTFTISCTGKVDKKEYKAATTVTVETPVVQKVLTQLNVTPTTVSANGEAMVSWTSKYADSCVLTKSNYDAAGKIVNTTQISALQYGSNLSSGPLTQTTKFMLTCKNSLGSEVSFVDVKVGATAPAGEKPAVTINTDKTTVNTDGEVLVSYASKLADSCVVTKANVDAVGNLTNKTQFYTMPYASNIKSGPIKANTRFLLECKNKIGLSSAFADVKVAVPLVPVPTAEINAKVVGTTRDQFLIVWTSTNAKTCVMYKEDYDSKGFTNRVQLSTALNHTGLASGKLLKNTQFTLSCNNGAGGGIVRSVQAPIAAVVIPPAVELTAKITAEPAIVTQGGASSISWTSTGATSCNVYENDGNTLWKTGLTGAKIPTTPILKVRQYTLSCSANGKTVASSVSIGIKAPPVPTTGLTAKIWATPMSVTAGQTTNISWTSTGAAFCNVYENDGNTLWKTGLNGTNTVSLPLSKNRQYTLSCSQSGKTVASSVTIEVKPAVATVKPTAKLTVTPESTKIGQAVKVDWTSTNADKCTLVKGATQVSTNVSGTLSSGPLSESVVYWLTCTNSIGSYSDAVAVQVN